jgi:hypothetical protein
LSIRASGLDRPLFFHCAYCGKIIGEKEPLEDKKISHGCCEECYLKELEKLKITTNTEKTNKGK